MAALSSATGHGSGTRRHARLHAARAAQGRGGRRATDEWALAALAYECLTGANPFRRRRVEAASALLRSPTRARSDFDARAARRSTTSCSRALARSPSIAIPPSTPSPTRCCPAWATRRRAATRSAARRAVRRDDPETTSRPAGSASDCGTASGPLGYGLLRGVAAAESGLAHLGRALGVRRRAAAALRRPRQWPRSAASRPRSAPGSACSRSRSGCSRCASGSSRRSFALGAAPGGGSSRAKRGAAVLPLAAPVLGIARVPSRCRSSPASCFRRSPQRQRRWPAARSPCWRGASGGARRT